MIKLKLNELVNISGGKDPNCACQTASQNNTVKIDTSCQATGPGCIVYCCNGTVTNPTGFAVKWNYFEAGGYSSASGSCYYWAS